MEQVTEATEAVLPRRRGALAGWLLVTAGLAACYAQTFVEMWRRWFPAWRRANLSLYDRFVEGESYYTHAPLVPIVSLVIAVLLVRHTRIAVAPRRRLGWIVIGLSLLVHLAASYARVNFASGFTLMGVAAGLILVLWGGAALRRLWFPVALVAFMVPLPEVSIAQLNFRLKMMAADWGVRIVNVLGILAERSGNQVFMEGGKNLIIANVCNGLRTLISLLAFGAIYAYICKLRGGWRLLLFAMSVPVAVVSNSIRIVSLILVADLWDVKTATGWYHDTSGLLIYAIAFLLMFGLERLVLWVRALAGRPAEVRPLFYGVRRNEDEDDGQWDRMVVAATGGAAWSCVALAVAAGAATLWLNRMTPPPQGRGMVEKALPADLEAAGQTWHGYAMPLDENTLTILEWPDYVLRRYVSRGSPAMDFCVIFSRDNRKGVHPPDLCLEGGGQDILAKADLVVPDVAGRGDVPCREILVFGHGETQYFLYTYRCGDTYTRSFWRQQFTILVNGLANRSAAGALVRVSTPVGNSVDEARRRATALMGAAVPYLDRAMP